MSITTVIKSIQDIMRQDAGVDGDAQRISQLVWMLFLKIFDDKEYEYELMDNKYKSPVQEHLRWRNWAADEEGITGEELLDFVNNNLFKTLKELSVDEYSDPRGFIVKEVFGDAYNYMKSGTLIRQVINKINQVNFNKSEDRHVFNEIYEKILKDLQSAGNAGEYYTPRAVTQFMADMVNPKLGEKVLDPACGTGGFLTCALESIRKNEVTSIEDRTILQNSIIGIEKKPMPHLLATTNLILHEIELPQIRRDNSLSRPIRNITQKDRVEVILTNPPFGGMEEPGIESNFPSGLRTKETADLFLVLVIHILKNGGRAGIVLPDGFLFGEGAKRRIKEKLLSECNLHTIVRLPKGVFNPYTLINTNLLFFAKGEPTKEVWYFEHPLPEDYKNYTKTKPIQLEEFDLEKGWWDNRNNDKFCKYAWKVSLEDIKKRNYNLDINHPNRLEKNKARPPLEILNNMEKNNKAISNIISKIRLELSNEPSKS